MKGINDKRVSAKFKTIAEFLLANRCNLYDEKGKFKDDYCYLYGCDDANDAVIHNFDESIFDIGTYIVVPVVDLLFKY